MLYKFVKIAGAVVACAGLQCFAQADGNYARVRVFKDAAISLYPDSYCYGGNNPARIAASDGPPSIFSLNKKVGMPLTDDMPEGYNEYVVAAGKPLSVMLQWEAQRNGVQASCGPLGATFFPQAGRDYDVTVGYAGSCFVQVRELYEIAAGRAGAKMAPAAPSYACN